jgi:FkbM family methyltransferase
MNEMSIEAQLDDLIAESHDSVVRRERAMVEELALADGDPFVLFGAGAWGRLTLSGLRKAGVEPAVFVDNNPTKWGMEVDGLGVLSLTDAADRFGKRVPFVVTVYTGDKVRRQVRETGLRAVPFPVLALRFPSILMPHNCVDFPHKMVGHAARIREGLSLWADEASRREYVAQVRYRLSFDDRVPPCLPPAETYFPDDLIVPADDEVFVDCGAYDGDSVRDFLRRRGNKFSRIIALEPDPQNIARLKASIASLADNLREKVEVVAVAAGSRHGTVHFDATGTVGSAVGEGGTLEVSTAPLDDVLREYHPSYIKMDIEGAEPDALAGAREVILRDLPVLAVCLYHRQEDLWQIPLQIRQITDRYHFFLRRYSDDCWEQVCYAIPRNRLVVRSHTDKIQLSL